MSRIDTAGIYKDLHRRLMTARFRPGEKLKPAALQGEYGCSANTLRDVLLRLTKVGLVEFEMQRGFRVREASEAIRADITRFRILLEQEGAALSMRKGGLEWEARLSAAHHALSHIETQVERAGEIEAHMSLWSEAERGFHDTLISACGSPVLRETFNNIYAQFRQQMVSLTLDFGRGYFGPIIAEHLAILEAALARDEAACRVAIHDHLKRHLQA